MLEALNLFLVTTTGYLLDWTLNFPRIAVLIMVGVGEALIITYIQKFTTNQDRLKRMKADKARLKQLIKQAKKNRDKEAVKRYRSTNSAIATLHMKMELAPIVISLIPIIFLATWAFARLGYIPPKAGDPLVVKAYFPPADIGKLAHVLPQENLDATAGWFQKITEDRDAAGKVTNGIALWTLQSKSDGYFTVPIRYEGKTTTKEILVDGRKYAEPLQFYQGTGVEAVELVMPEYKPLGIIPGIPWLTFPPWLVGDLMIVIPLSLLLRPILRVY